MIKYFENLARALLNQPFRDLDKSEQKIIQSIAENTTQQALGSSNMIEQKPTE